MEVTMPSRFLHIGVNFKERAASPETRGEIESVLNKALDWYRYAPNCWIVRTKQTAKTWHDRLKSIPWMTDQQYLIVEINVQERAGWLPKDTWDWLKKKRSEN
jgi:hypothetical protein